MKVRWSLFTGILILLHIILIESSSAQNPGQSENPNQYVWLNMGIGGSSFGLSTGLSLNYQYGKKLFTLRYNYNEEDCFICSVSPLLKIYDVGLLYGISSRKGGWALASISCGLSLVGYNERAEYVRSSGQLFGTAYYKEIKRQTVGVPIEAQLFLNGKALGIGVVAFGNINPHQSYAGLLLCLQLGQLR